MDVLFGTYRCLPQEPEALGVSEPMPQSYVGQTLHPFRAAPVATAKGESLSGVALEI